MAGVICRGPNFKRIIQKIIVQPSMQYGMEIGPLTSSNGKTTGKETEMKTCR